ncbi:MAG: Fur family transcriptional regulator [Dehalococcoidales bacterium]|nr:Fur family transcriptional regulator [Dehalococcoidales bacterium]
MSTNRKTIEETRRALKAPGLRVTSQRALILDIIRRGGGHLDADEVYRRARQKQPRLSLSTVYRTLQTLKKLGLVEELHFNEEHHHYEVKPAADHHHLVCLNCGRVLEFEYPLARMIKNNVPEAKDFEITETELHIGGYCAECRRKRE